MSYYRTPKSVKTYTWFKFLGTLILICIFAILLLHQQRAATTAPVVPPTFIATVRTSPALPTPKPIIATSTLTAPLMEVDEPADIVKAPVISAPRISAEGIVTFSGTGTPGSLVEVCAIDGCVGQATVGTDGVWTLIIQLDPGDYHFTARAVDASSVPLAESPSLKLVIPASKQAPTLAAPQPGAFIAGNLVTLAGAGTPGVEIEILDQGKVLSATVVQPDGTWTLDCLCDSGLRLLSVQNAGDPDSVSEAVAIQVAVAPIPIPEELVCDEEDIPMGIDYGTVYVVAPCEYIGLIAARVGVKLADLLAANPQVPDPDRIDPGQILNLPPR